MDPTRKVARLVLDETPAVPVGPLGDHAGDLARASPTTPRSRCAAELVGVCDAALEMADRVRQGAGAVRPADRHRTR